jgi:hypothetical protein
LLEIACHVVGGTCVGVPVGVDAVRPNGGVDVSLIRDIVSIKGMPTV